MEGQIPHGWRRVPISQLYLGLYDGPHATPPPADIGPVFLGIGNITDDGCLDLTSVRRINEADYPKWTRRVVPQMGDIVFTYEATLNRYAIIPVGFRGCLGRRLALIRPDPTKVDTRFLHYSFFSADWRRTIERNRLAGATVDRIPIARFPQFPINIPSLEAQRRISSVLSAYDDLIENNARRVATLRKIVDLVFGEFRRRGSRSCRTVSLGEVCDRVSGRIRTGPFGSQLHESDYSDTGTPVVMPKDIVSGRISTESIARVPDEILNRLFQHKLEEGNIVYGRRGDIGRRAYVFDRQKGWLCGTGCIRISLPGEVLHSRYLYEYLGLPEVISLIAGRAIGATMPNLNTAILRGVPIDLPPYAIQARFAKTVEPMDQLAEGLIEEIDHLRSARNLLLPKLISGEIDLSAAASTAAETAAA